MDLKDLPTFLLKPLPRSRVKGHHQTMAMFRMDTDTGFSVELAICEHVFAQRSASSSGWSKWNDTAMENHQSAIGKLRLEAAAWEKRGYYSIVSTGLLLPLNETDTRHLRNDGLLPRAMLEYGSELFDAVVNWRNREVEKNIEIAKKVAGVSSTPPTPAKMPPPAGSAPTGPRKDLDSVLGKLRSAGAAMDSSKDF